MNQFETERELLAYLAGAMDADGYFRIKRNSLGIRRGTSKNPTYMEMVGLHQVTPQVPELLRDTFGGTITIGKSSTKNGKPFYRWNAVCRDAYYTCERLRPFLVIKRERADLVIELTKSRESMYGSHAYWFKKENPTWETMPLISFRDVMVMLNYSTIYCVWDSYRKGYLVSIPGEKTNKSLPRVPRKFVENVLNDGGMRSQPKQLVDWRYGLFIKMKEMNKIGL